MKYIMDLNEALEVLEIDQNELGKITLETLKQRYRKLALLHHPDKNGNTVESKEKFQKINEAYTTITREIRVIYDDYDDTDTPNKEHNTGYLFILQIFIDSILQGKYNEFISGIIKDIVMGVKKISLKLFEDMDKERIVVIYNFMFKYKAILHIGQDALDKIRDVINEKYMDVQIYVLNPSITDLFEQNVYVLNHNGTVYYVPLWHSELHFDGPKADIIVNCVPDLPDNMSIDEDNNLLIDLHFSFTFSLITLVSIPIKIGNKVLEIPIDELKCKRVQTYTFKKRGFAKIIETNMYSVDEIADIIVKITFDP